MTAPKTKTTNKMDDRFRRKSRVTVHGRTAHRERFQAFHLERQGVRSGA